MAVLLTTAVGTATAAVPPEKLALMPLPKEAYGKSQFSLWPGYELGTNSRALYVAHSVRPLPKALTNDFPKCELVEDFFSLHKGRPMSRFRIFLCTR